MIGLSNAPIPLPQITVTPSVATQPLAPNIAQYDSGYTTFSTQSGGSTLQYPNDNPKYIWTATFSQYTRNSLNQVGQYTSAGPNYPGIILPLPDGLVDVNRVNWKEEELGFAAGNIINSIVSNGQTDERVAQGALGAGVGLTQAGIDAVGNKLGLQGAGSAAAILTSQIAASQGYAPNQFLTLLMHGPTFKRHTWHWTFAPNNNVEANQIRQICNVFRNAMAPGIAFALANSPVIWSYPKIMFVRLYPNSKHLMKFKPMIVESFAVSYAPLGRASFSRNDAQLGQNTGNIGENPPTAVQVQMNTIELEFWTAGNFNDSNIPDNVYTNDSSVPTTTLQDLENKAAAKLGSAGAAVQQLAGEINPFHVTPAQ